MWRMSRMMVARLLLSLVFAARGQFEESRRHLERALNLAPGDADNESNLCYALTHLGRADEAIVHCSAALRINPESTNAQFNLSNAMAAKAGGR